MNTRLFFSHGLNTRLLKGKGRYLPSSTITAFSASKLSTLEKFQFGTKKAIVFKMVNFTIVSIFYKVLCVYLEACGKFYYSHVIVIIVL